MHIGFDVGGTKIQGALLRNGELIRSRKVPTPSDYDGLVSMIGRLHDELTGGRGRAERMAVGLPGTVSDQRVQWVPNLRYLDGRGLAVDLADRVGVDVLLANDAQLTLLGEAWRGAAVQRDSAALVSIGTGIGGAIMFGGRIIRGANRSAGAFGWLNLDADGPRDPDHGNLELRASGRALEAIGRACTPPMTTYQIIENARAGREPAAGIVGRLGHMLGVSAAMIASALDPETIVFSGGLSDAFDLMAPGIRAAFTDFCSPSVRRTPLVPAALGPDASLCGATRAAMLGESAFG